MKFLNVSQVAVKTGISPRTLYRWINEGKFPMPIRLSDRLCRWTEEEVEVWMKEKAAR